jgi:hypothetical protein
LVTRARKISPFPDDLLEFLGGVASLLAMWSQQGQDSLVNERAPVVPECTDDVPENHCFIKYVLFLIIV